MALIELHVHIHGMTDVQTALLHDILAKETKMAVDLTALTAAVAAEKTVLDSAIAFINGVPALVAAAVKQALLDAGVNDTAAQATADAAAQDIQNETAAVQAALTAGTAPPVTP